MAFQTKDPTEGVPLIFVTNRTRSGWVVSKDCKRAQHSVRSRAHPGPWRAHLENWLSSPQAAIAGRGWFFVAQAFNALKAGLLVLPFGHPWDIGSIRVSLSLEPSHDDHENKRPFVIGCREI
jgi:hypothetical protein